MFWLALRSDRLRQREQAPQGACEPGLRRGEPWIAAPSAGSAAARWLAPTAVLRAAITAFQRLALVRHVALAVSTRFGISVVAALQLHIESARKRVL